MNQDDFFDLQDENNVLTGDLAAAEDRIEALEEELSNYKEIAEGLQAKLDAIGDLL